MMYKKYIKQFMSKAKFSSEDSEYLLSAYDNIKRNPDAHFILMSKVRLFDLDILHDYKRALSELQKVADICELPKETVNLIFLMCLTRHTEELYEQRNIDKDIYMNSMLDLKWKLVECKKMKKICGTDAAEWHWRFFNLTRFAIGRLQFETDFSNHKYIKGEHMVYPGDTVISVHIPSCGMLDELQVIDSYIKAENFYKDLFGKGAVPFMCYSWLLYPQHDKILPKESNIRKFKNRYDIVDYTVNSGDDLWRIFYTDKRENPNTYPQTTSLQRAYVKMLNSGIKPGCGCGFFFMKNGSFIK